MGSSMNANVPAGFTAQFEGMTKPCILSIIHADGWEAQSIDKFVQVKALRAELQALLRDQSSLGTASWKRYVSSSEPNISRFDLM